MTIDFLDQAAAALRGKRVLVRSDLDVPTEAGRVTDDHKIRDALPTLELLLQAGARVLVASHRGRTRRPGPEDSLEAPGETLAELLGQEVRFIDECVGDGVKMLAGELQDGQLLLLENVCFRSEEERDDDTFARALATGVDAYVNDAPALLSRAHASIHAVTRHVPRRYAGQLVRFELDAAHALTGAPEGTAALLLGGDRLAGREGVLATLLARARVLVVGGGVGETFRHAAGMACDEAKVETARVAAVQQVLATARDRGVRVVFHGDDVERTTLEDVRALLWSGSLGTHDARLALAVAEATRRGTFSVLAGDDTVAELGRAHALGGFRHVSRAGTAFLDLVEGRDVPGLQALHR
ncbi:MAG: phosphoglycerate kinase [Deltaproteobacteria bacterium]|nr:phosphoglycerate kinase [Deltaproteobacteria bacterium]